MPRHDAVQALGRYELAAAADRRFEGTVLAVTHDRWFTRSFDRFLLVGADGGVRETPAPVWETA